MRKLLFSLFVSLFFVGAVYADENVNKIVFFNPGTRAASRAKIIKELGGTVTADLHLINASAVTFPVAAITRMENELSANRSGLIRSMEDDKLLYWLNADTAAGQLGLTERPAGAEIVSPVPAKAQEDKGWFSDLSWGITRVKADKVWKYNTGEGVKVAVIDTGIDMDHPELAENIIGGYNAIDSSLSPNDDQGHGTHVAGTIAGRQSKKDLTGIAPKAKLFAVKVLDQTGHGTFSAIALGIQWAVDHKVNVINMSIGSGHYDSEALKLAVAAAAKAGITVVCAAGNDHSAVDYPAAYPGAIAVSALDIWDGLAEFSCSGPEIQFIAPGVDIISTYKDGSWARMSGTSMASPHIAGLAALAIYTGAKSPDEVVAKLKTAAVKLKKLTPEKQGNGLIDATLIK